MISVRFPQRIRLIQAEDDWGVVRCAHVDKDLVLPLCNQSYDLKDGMKVSLMSQWASGTLRALRRKI